MIAMKKIMAILLCAFMVFPLAACGSDKAESQFDIDYESSEVQKVSEERATAAVLTETAQVWLEGLNSFAGTDLSKYTYQDFVEHIGVEASEYYNDSGSRVYTWIASDDESGMMAVWFSKGLTGWNLEMLGTTNLS